MHFIFFFLLFSLPSFSMTADAAGRISPSNSNLTSLVSKTEFSIGAEACESLSRGTSPFHYFLNIDLTKVIDADFDSPRVIGRKNSSNPPTPCPSETDSGYPNSPPPTPEKTHMPKEKFKALLDRIDNGKLNVSDASKESGFDVKVLKKALKNRNKKLKWKPEQEQEHEFQSALRAINNGETTINQVHKELGFPVNEIISGLIKMFGSKRLLLKEKFLSSTTSFDKDLDAINDSSSPVCIAWVVEKHNQEKDSVINVLKLKQKTSASPEKRPTPKKTENHSRNLGVRALKELVRAKEKNPSCNPFAALTIQ